MTKSRILDRNFLNLDLLSNEYVSSEQASFPVLNLYNQQRRSKVWRSNGYWDITNTINTIVFNDGSGNFTATIAIDEYNSDTLFFAAIKTAMEAVGGQTYTISRDSSTKKIRFQSNGATFQIIWTLSTCGDILGFDDAVDSTGAVNYLADEIKTGTSEWIKWDFGISTNPQAFVLIGKRNEPIQISPSAVVKLQGNSTDVWTNPEYEEIIAVQDNVMSIFKDDDNDGLHTEALRYWRCEIADTQNLNGYVELGSAFLGDFFEPERGAVTIPFNGQYIDRSVTVFSEGGQTFSDIREKSEEFSLDWYGLTITEKERIDEIFDKFGTSLPFFVSIDPVSAASTANDYYLRFVKFVSEPNYDLVSPGNYSCSMNLREEL